MVRIYKGIPYSYRHIASHMYMNVNIYDAHSICIYINMYIIPSQPRHAAILRRWAFWWNSLGRRTWWSGRGRRADTRSPQNQAGWWYRCFRTWSSSRMCIRGSQHVLHVLRILRVTKPMGILQGNPYIRIYNVYIYIYTHTNIYIYIYIYIDTNTYINLCMYVGPHACKHGVQIYTFIGHLHTWTYNDALWMYKTGSVHVHTTRHAYAI